MKWSSVFGTILQRGASNFVELSLLPILGETDAPLANLISSPNAPISWELLVGCPSFDVATTTSVVFHSSTPLQLSRGFSSSSDSGSSNVVPIETEEEFNSSLRDVQGRFLSPVITQLSEEYPHVTTYNIDDDQKCLNNVLTRLFITSVPTLHFYQNGKKAAEITGADVEKLKQTMELLYGKD